MSCEKLAGWMDTGWVDGKAGLRIAYSNQKQHSCCTKLTTIQYSLSGTISAATKLAENYSQIYFALLIIASPIIGFNLSLMSFKLKCKDFFNEIDCM